MPGLSAGAIAMLVIGIVLLYGVGLGLGIYRAWKSSKAKKQA